MTSVRVYCRIRPFNKRELNLGNLIQVMEIRGKEIHIPDRKKRYAYDHSFSETSTQEEVFSVVGHAVIGDFMEGFNATQFVYGQTGAGKSWTMMGIKDDPELSGIIPRSSALIFQQISERPDGWKFEIEASYLEIYMERVNDLLDPDKQNLDVKESREKGVFIPGLSVEAVSCLEDVYDIIDRGDRVRKVAATKMNAGSSRSHSVLSLYLDQTNPEGVKITSQLNLVDLAGSERLDKTGATGEVLKQGTLINLSLTVLSQVISGLSKRAEAGPEQAKKIPIPYRDSKLSRLLQTSLGGNAKTGLSIHVSPHLDNLEESISTFEFGKRAKMIKNNAKAKVQRSAEQLEKEIEKLQAAYDKLKKAFEALSGGKLPPGLLESAAGGGASSEELETERAKVQELEMESTYMHDENDKLKTEITELEVQLSKQDESIKEAKRDYDIKDLEVRALQSKLRELGALDGDVDIGAYEDVAGGVGSSSVSGYKGGSNPTQQAALAELNGLVNKQKDMLHKVRHDNKGLKQENNELTDELEEKTRRLALAELQVMRYENARNRVKDSKIKVKITSGKPKANAAWRNLLDKSDGVQSSNVPQVDIEKLREGSILEKFGGLNPVPLEELKGGREGPLEERLYQKTKFVRRWFVLRDSYLFCYENKDSPLIEPRFCIPLAESKVGSCPKQGDHEYCFMVLCGTYFNVMAASTESEKAVWLKDLGYGKYATHENLVCSAYFTNRALDAIPDAAEQEAFRHKLRDAPYAMLCESDYVHETSSCGGMEGFLSSSGFNSSDPKQMKPYYCVLKDSHFLLYDLIGNSELITEPKGILYMGNNISVVKQSDESDGFYFTAMSTSNDSESIALCTDSEEIRERWLRALNAATKVTTRNVMMAALDKEQVCIKAGIKSFGEFVSIYGGVIPHQNSPDADLQGFLLDPLCVQPYDDKQKPLYRHPNGKIMTRDLAPVSMDAKKFSKKAEPLDFFNRPLPPNATPMFAANPREPIGVGVDGKHYAYPSGREFSDEDKHFDFEGQSLPVETVKAANQIVQPLKVACIVRSAMLTPSKDKYYDAFGRPFKQTRDGTLLLLEGEELGPKAAVFDSVGNRIKMKKPEAGAVKTLEAVYFSNSAERQVLGKIGIEVQHTTLADVFALVKKNLAVKISAMTFIDRGMPIPDQEREFRFASDFLPSITISLRDIHGKRVTFDGKTFAVDVDHTELDGLNAKEKENEFIKVVSTQKNKKTGRTTARSGIVSPRASPRP